MHIIKNRMKKNRGMDIRGFTLLEIMAVVMIIMLILGFAITQVGGRYEVARNNAAQAMIKGTLKSALNMYNMDNGSFPSTEQGLKALVEKPTSDPVPSSWQSPYIDSMPKDPWGRDYIYVCPGTHNPDSYDLSSKGKDGKESEDDVANWSTK